MMRPRDLGCPWHCTDTFIVIDVPRYGLQVVLVLDRVSENIASSRREAQCTIQKGRTSIPKNFNLYFMFVISW
jgi:hypothetical protein